MRIVVARLTLSCILLITLGAVATAQGAPEPIQDALAAFNEQLGIQLTLNDFFWTWEQQTFLDSGLGCAQPGEITAPGSVVGYRFVFTYDNRSYEYRVSADRTTTVFCGTVTESSEGGGPDIAGNPDDQTRLSNSLCPPPPSDSFIYPRTRIAPDTEARVTGAPSNLRTEPNVNAAVVVEIPFDGVFRVLAGPICDAEGLLWAHVEFDGQTGYAAEADPNGYFVEPLPPSGELPANRPTLNAANVAGLREAARLQGNFGSGLAWSQTNKLTVTGDTGAEGVWVYTPTAITQQPRIIRSLDRFEKAVFSVAANQRDTLLLGSSDGSVHLWDLGPSSSLIERAVLNGHNSAVTAVAFSPDGRRFVSSGGYALAVTEDPFNQNAILVWDINTVTQLFALRGHEGAVTAVSYSPDGRTIASASRDGSVRLWDASNGLQTARIDGTVGATAMAYSPDGAWLVVGYEDGTTKALALVESLSAGPVIPTHDAAINVIAFSPDSNLVASGAADGSVAVRASDQLLTSDPAPFASSIHSGSVKAAAFSPDGTVLASLGLDNTVRLLTSQ